MAKAYQTLAVLAPIGEVCWFKRLNAARLSGDYGTDKDLQEVTDRLVLHGWLQDTNGVIDVEPITDELAEEALLEREEEWSRLKEGAKTNKAENTRLKVFELLYCVDGGKKLIRPKFTGISGNRRSSVLFKAMVARYEAGKPVSTLIPVIDRGKLSPLERLQIQVGENEEKTSGFRAMSNADRILAAKEVIKYGGLEANLATTFKRGMSQKLWGIVRLDSLWPNVRIAERMCLPEEDAQHIKWGVNKEDLRALADRSDPETLAEYNRRRMVKGEPPVEAATEAEVISYFGDPKANGKQSSAMMERKTIEGLGKNFPNVPLRTMATAIATKNADLIKPYDGAAPGFNALDELLKAGDYPPVERILAVVVLAKGQARVDLLKRLLAVCDEK